MSNQANSIFHCSSLTKLVILFLVYFFCYFPYESQLYAQCKDPQGQALDRYFKIVYALDQNYVDAFGGNEMLARIQAEKTVDSALIKLNALFNGSYKLHFKKIFFPHAIAPAKGGLDADNWTISVVNFYRDSFPCIPFDGILLFTNAIGSGLDIGRNGVAIIGGTTGNPDYVVAHEVGHIIGMLHIEDPTCCAEHTFMCPSGNKIKLSACEGINYMNNNVFTSANCSLWADDLPVYPDEYVCPPNTPVQILLTTEDPNPVKNCRPDGDIVTFTVTLINNNTTSVRNIRVKLSADDRTHAEFVPDTSLDFDCIQVYSNRTEFWITGGNIGVAQNLKATSNTIRLVGNGVHYGIKLEGGDRNNLNCNEISNPGGGDNDGLYTVHASRARIVCNGIDGTTRGLHLEGMMAGLNKALVAGNTMKDNNEAGLLLGTDAVIGGQTHRGNKWENSEALGGINADVHSKFIVDADENADFLPDAWLPFNWFENIASHCPLPDGEAVLRARSILMLAQDSPVHYDDIAICNCGERSVYKLQQGIKSTLLSVHVYPNPTSGDITIAYKGLGASELRFVLFNTFGQIVQEIILAPEQEQVHVSFKMLPEGVYWYKILGNNDLSGKLIISQ